MEESFWKWIDAEDAVLARAQAKPATTPPVAHVELAKSVNPADWQSLIAGYREANKEPDPLPSNAAFVLKGETIERKIGAAEVAKCIEIDFRAAFEGNQFWIFDNFMYGADCFLMATPTGTADLIRDKSGSFHGRVNGPPPCEKAIQVLAVYRNEVFSDPARLLPLREHEVRQFEATYLVERVVRPTPAKTGWEVRFTRRIADDPSELSYQLELDPGHRWRITHIVGEKKGDWRVEVDLAVPATRRRTDACRHALAEDGWAARGDRARGVGPCRKPNGKS